MWGGPEILLILKANHCNVEATLYGARHEVAQDRGDHNTKHQTFYSTLTLTIFKRETGQCIRTTKILLGGQLLL